MRSGGHAACTSWRMAVMVGSTSKRLCLWCTKGLITRVELEHSSLTPLEAAKHAVGWPHFIAWLGVAAGGEEPGIDPWKHDPPG